MSLCVISGQIRDPSETAISGAVIKARITSPTFITTIQTVPKELSTTSDVTGAWSLSISQGLHAMISIEYPPNSVDSNLRAVYAIIVPASGTANFSTLVTETS